MHVCSTENFIDGNEFAGLTEADIKNMVPAIGLAKKIIRLVPKVLYLHGRTCYTITVGYLVVNSALLWPVYVLDCSAN